MTLKTSFFESAMYKRNLRKCVLPAIFFVFVWLFVLPIGILNGVYTSANEIAQLQSVLLECAKINGSIVAFCYGLCIAWLLNFYLFRTNSAYYQASLPIRRETVYLTNYLSGLLLYIIPAALVALLTAGAASMVDAPMFTECFQWFAAGLLGYLFFYSFAFALSMVVGHMAAMPVFYAILNFTAYVVTNIVVVLLATFVYGLSDRVSIATRYSALFSPLVHLLGDGTNIHRFYNSEGYFTGCCFEGWDYLAILAGVGIVFAVLGWLLYRVRHMERSGDVIAIRHLQPVFVYAFTIGCALVLGIGMMVVINLDFATSGNFGALMIFLFIGAFIGFFLAQMMLKKTLKVFGDKGSWLRYAIVCAVLLALFGSMKLDFFGYVRYVPDVDEVQSVSLGEYAAEENYDDPAFIQKVLDLHQRLLDDRAQLTAYQGYDDDYWYQNISIRYTLKNGRIVERYYSLTIFDHDYPGSAIEQFEQVYDDPDYLIVRVGLPEPLSAQNIVSCHIYRYDNSGTSHDVYLTGQEALDFYRTCILPDLKSSSLGKSDLYARHNMADVEFYYLGEVEFELTGVEGSRWYHFGIPTDAENTVRYMNTLLELQR